MAILENARIVMEDNENRPSQTETPDFGCGLSQYTVDILVKTVKFVLVERNTEEGLIKGRIEFECVPYVDGSITLEFSEMVLGSPGSSPTKNVLDTVLLDVEQGLNEKLMHVPIKFPKRTTHLKYPYKLEIKTEGKEGGSRFDNFQLTSAVIETVKGEFQIRVTDKILWLDGHRFFYRENSIAFRPRHIVYRRSNQIYHRACLIINNPRGRHLIENCLVTSEKIGTGSNTTVFNGTFHGRPCAVKRHPVTNEIAARNDINIMMDIDTHSNIVSYYGMSKDVNFVLVVVERCKSSLDKLIASRVFENDEYKLTLEGFEDLILWKRRKDPREDPCKVYPSEHLVKFLRGIVCGLCWLHSHNISHNNLKSQNVLISRDTTVDDTTVVDIIPKLSNFSRSTIGVSSSGGQDPENEKPTFPGDLLALGNLLLDCITITRDGKALSKKVKKINWVTHLPEAHDLITLLQDSDPKLRPTSTQAYYHPFFWDFKERVEFIRLASDWIELEPHGSKIREPIFQHKDYKGWDQKITDKELLKEITDVKQNYHGVNLLRAMRNKYGHYITQSEKLDTDAGDTLRKLDKFFSGLFPDFLMLVYVTLRENLVEGKLFDQYFNPQKIEVVKPLPESG